MIGNVRAARRARNPAFIPRLMALEDRTLLATLVVNPAGGPGVFTTIQAAVNAANPAGGDTIQIHPATYTEQVTIDKSLTMMGTGPGVIIESPPTLTPDLGLNSLVEIKNAAIVTVSELTIQGPVPQGITIDAGILVVGGATANVTNSTIAHIRNETLNNNSGTGYGILVGDVSGGAQVGTATITNDTIMDYQKNGILVRDGSTATITGNTIATAGPASVIAQNGIVITAGATATITGNTITGNQYTGPGGGPDPFNSTQASGIVVFGSASVTGNTVTGNDIDIASNTTGATISGNTVENSFEGVFLLAGTATVSSNTIDGNNIGVALVAFVGDTANTEGTLVSNNIFNNGNGALSFPGAGISVLAESGATTTPVATANFNRIVGNSVGLNNGTTTPADAPLNWWGINTGPNTTGGDKTSGSVTTSPWLVLSIAASLGTIGPGGTTSVTANVTNDSSGATHSVPPFFPNGIPITFGATGGTITPASVPTQSGTASSSFTSTMAGSPSVSATLDNQTVSITIAVQPIALIPPPTPQQSTVGDSFSQSFPATGGAGGFVYTVSAGQLAPDLVLDPNTGLVSGPLTTPGAYTFTVTVTDVSGASASASLTIVVNPSVAINPNTPPQGTVGAPYADQLSATGGIGTLTFALASGTTLPPGLSLSNAGLITGTPTTAGTFPFTVTATDQRGAGAALPLSIVVIPAQVAAPVVASLQRFGFHAQPTTFVLTFSTALAPASAEDVANYRLNSISGHQLGPAIPIKNATYNPNAHTVTLHPAHRVYLFHQYRLLVNGSTPTGVTGATGLLLDGNGNGQPGSDFVTTFGKTILAGPNVQVASAERSPLHRSRSDTLHSRRVRPADPVLDSSSGPR